MVEHTYERRYPDTHEPEINPGEWLLATAIIAATVLTLTGPVRGRQWAMVGLVTLLSRAHGAGLRDMHERWLSLVDERDSVKRQVSLLQSTYDAALKRLNGRVTTLEQALDGGLVLAPDAEDATR